MQMIKTACTAIYYTDIVSSIEESLSCYMNSYNTIYYIEISTATVLCCNDNRSKLI